ncbi:MAG: DUF6273 domain-containing protein [Propionibacteriaceae bacterium]|jgi:hypothetical protein|nr:DUF6273 domain-containing protein [Propionibacteriaceae bacterium]
MMTGNKWHLEMIAGGQVWVALSVNPIAGRALFVARDIVAERPYHEKYVHITWEECSLRKWLNGAFFDSLPARFKSRVIERTIKSPDNAQYNISCGDRTKDRVFLLSLDEVEKYLKSDADRRPGYGAHSKDWWWLRSPGEDQVSAACVHGNGFVASYGSEVGDRDGGVRPALWLSLDA